MIDEITQHKETDLPVFNHCEYCHKEFIDNGCGVCCDCYWQAMEEAQASEKDKR